MITAPRIVAVAGLLATTACSASRSDPAASATPVRLAPPDPVVTCSEWVSRAVADPEIGVERVPAAIAMQPAPFPKRLPDAAYKDGHAEVRIRVLVDTVGVADMSTFSVVKSTHPALTRSVRAAVAKWKFSPAEVGGCKVPRNFNWGAVQGGSKAGG